MFNAPQRPAGKSSQLQSIQTACSSEAFAKTAHALVLWADLSTFDKSLEELRDQHFMLADDTPDHRQDIYFVIKHTRDLLKCLATELEVVKIRNQTTT